jgi:hypothetical protein
MEHHSHTDHKAGPRARPGENYLGLAFSATLHCLVGCGLGEVLGMVLGTALKMSNISTMIIAIVLGALLGLAFGIYPLVKAGFIFKRALRQVLIAEGLSIVVMETFEALVQFYTPGVMEAHVNEWIFWKGMLLGLAAGFVAAFPVNYFFIKKGIRHDH